MVYIHLRCMKFEYNVYLDLYRVHNFFFVKSPYNLYILSVKRFSKSVHEIVTSGIISVHQDHSCEWKVMSFNLAFSIDYYTSMCIYVYLSYIHRVSIEGTCPYMKKLEGVWELFLVLWQWWRHKHWDPKFWIWFGKDKIKL